MCVAYLYNITSKKRFGCKSKIKKFFKLREFQGRKGDEANNLFQKLQPIHVSQQQDDREIQQ